MRPTIYALPLIALLALAAGCSRNANEYQDSVIAASGLLTNKTYRCDAAVYDKPLRMFTTTGEVTDREVIRAYQELHPFFGDSSFALQYHPDNIFSTRSDIAYYNGMVPYRTMVTKGAIEMRQQDTGMYFHGNPQGSIDFMFNEERRFLAMRDGILEMRESVSRLQRVDEGNYEVRESFHLQGSYQENTIRLPYTFVASRLIYHEYPLALKTGALPKVPAGDTLVVREGYIEFK